MTIHAIYPDGSSRRLYAFYEGTSDPYDALIQWANHDPETAKEEIEADAKFFVLSGNFGTLWRLTPPSSFAAERATLA